VLVGLYSTAQPVQLLLSPVTPPAAPTDGPRSSATQWRAQVTEHQAPPVSNTLVDLLTLPAILANKLGFSLRAQRPPTLSVAIAYPPIKPSRSSIANPSTRPCHSRRERERVGDSALNIDRRRGLLCECGIRVEIAHHLLRNL
jgi:hypothetical protein